MGLFKNSDSSVGFPDDYCILFVGDIRVKNPKSSIDFRDAPDRVSAGLTFSSFEADVELAFVKVDGAQNSYEGGLKTTFLIKNPGFRTRLRFIPGDEDNKVGIELIDGSKVIEMYNANPIGEAFIGTKSALRNTRCNVCVDALPVGLLEATYNLGLVDEVLQLFTVFGPGFGLPDIELFLSQFGFSGLDDIYGLLDRVVEGYVRDVIGTELGCAARDRCWA